MNKTVLPFLAVMLLASPAMAHDMDKGPMHHGRCQHRWGHGPHPMFDKFDLNHDGQVTRAEFNKASARMFDRLDANHDGIITRDEAGAFQRDMMRRHHEEWLQRQHQRDDGPRPFADQGQPQSAKPLYPDYSRSNDDDGR